MHDTSVGYLRFLRKRNQLLVTRFPKRELYVQTLFFLQIAIALNMPHAASPHPLDLPPLFIKITRDTTINLVRRGGNHVLGLLQRFLPALMAFAIAKH